MCAEHEKTQGLNMLIINNLYLEEHRNFGLKLSKCQVQNLCLLPTFLQFFLKKVDENHWPRFVQLKIHQLSTDPGGQKQFFGGV